MNIKIKFQDPMQIEGIKSGDIIQVEEGTTLTDLLTRCNVKKEFQIFIVTLVNEESREPAYMLQEMDEVTLFMPVSGG